MFCLFICFDRCCLCLAACHFTVLLTAHPSSCAQPGLGEVLLSLLGALGAAQQLQRSAASLAPRQLALGPWRGDGDAAPSSGAQLGLVSERECWSVSQAPLRIQYADGKLKKEN